MEENKRGDYSITSENIEDRTKYVGIALKQQVAAEMAKQQAKEKEMEEK